ncbi:MAG: secondary thiamine-phosphate synthase enzyme YjbQ [Pseudomonadota bacterium]
MSKQFSLTIQTSGRSTIEITRQVNELVASLDQGLCHVFLHHTSASLIITENADQTVRSDLENFITRLIPDGDTAYQHDQEGDDDMPAHIRSVLTQTELTVPVKNGRLALGTWQGLYLWEHRYQPHNRKITITLIP